MLVWDAVDTRWIDDVTGDVVSHAGVIAVRDDLADAYAEQFRGLSLLYTSGAVTLDGWKDLFLALLIEAIAHGYVFGRGGFDRMAAADWSRVATVYGAQLAYAQNFIAEVEDAIDTRPPGTSVVDALVDLSASTASRSALYAGTVVQSYEQGQVAAVSEERGVLDMPVYPADGGTACGANCRCAWVITGDDEAQVWRCRWDTEGDGNVCDGCRERGRLYADLVIPYLTEDP